MSDERKIGHCDWLDASRTTTARSFPGNLVETLATLNQVTQRLAEVQCQFEKVSHDLAPFAKEKFS